MKRKVSKAVRLREAPGKLLALRELDKKLGVLTVPPSRFGEAKAILKPLKCAYVCYPEGQVQGFATLLPGKVLDLKDTPPTVRPAPVQAKTVVLR